MTENQPSFIPDWDPSKKYPREPSYVHTFLHHMGLKCLTTGHTRVHYFNPLEENKLALPDLASLEETHPILVRVGRRHGEEQDEDMPGTADLDEWVSSKAANQCVYWELFIEKKPKGNYGDAYKIYEEHIRVVVDWAEVPGRPDPDEISVPNVPAVPDFTFPLSGSVSKLAKAPSGPAPLVSTHVVYVNVIKKDTVFLSPNDALTRYRIDGQFAHIFEDMQAFLVLGNLAFLCTNLCWDHNDLEDDFKII